MRRLSSLWLVLITLSALALVAAGPASPPAVRQTISFDVGSASGHRDQFTFQVTGAGCIVAQINAWSRSGTSGAPASQLALILNGSDRPGYYARSDGSAPLKVSYAASKSDVRRVKTWTLSVVNFTKRGTAKGMITLEYPPNGPSCR